MTYKQVTPMQWITLYYYGDDSSKIKQAKERGLQMTKRIRYSNVIEEMRDEQLELLSDSPDRLVGMTGTGLIVMFENNN